MRLSLITLALGALLASLPAAADTLTYSGRLEAGNGPANGRFDLRLAVHGDAKYGTTLAAPMEFPAVPVVDGSFRVEFELPAGTDEAWVALSVRGAGESYWSEVPGRTKAVAAAKAIGQCWSSAGDEGSNPALNFLGTTDAQPLVLRTRNVQSLRIEPSTVLTNGNPVTANITAGSSGNSVTAGVRGATVSGGGAVQDAEPLLLDGGPNRVTDHYGAVGGGCGNESGDGAGTLDDTMFATVGGGQFNRATGIESTVGGGAYNLALNNGTTVGGGRFNSAESTNSTVSGGQINKASSSSSTVSGGSENTASGARSTVSGGFLNCAGGVGSWAGGTRAKVRPGTNSGAAGSGCGDVVAAQTANGDQGTFVWADSQSGNFVSSAPNQFLVRADGGVLFNTSALFSPQDDLIVRARSLTGDADVDFRLISRSGRTALMYLNDSIGQLAFGLPNLQPGFPRLEVTGGTGGTASLSNGGTWTNASSRSYKSGVTAIDPLDVLARLVALPISTWSYTGSLEGTHLGPMAEDFKAAFALAGDGTSIATVDADGVAMAAIQGLNAKLEAENAALLSRIEALERAVLGSRAEAR